MKPFFREPPKSDAFAGRIGFIHEQRGFVAGVSMSWIASARGCAREIAAIAVAGGERRR